MATPISDQDSQRDLIRQLNQHQKALDESGNLLGTRRDVFYAMIFMVSDTPSVHHAVQLFWNMYQPRLYPSPEAPNLSAKDIYLSKEDTYKEINPPAPAPSAELNELLLDCLDWMYDKYRIPPYEPDADDSENLTGLVIKLHIAAARAFKLKQVDLNQMSEEWMSTLHSVERTMERIKTIASPYWYPSFAVSTDAIWGMTQLELSRVSRADGSYADAIDYLTQSSHSYIEAFNNLGDINAVQALFGIEISGNAGPKDKHSGSPWTSLLDWDDETIKNEEICMWRDIESRNTPLQVSLEEVSFLFDLLKQSPPADTNWREISEECKELAVLSLMNRNVFTGLEDFLEIDDEWGQSLLSWSEFWYSAHAWASTQLSPSEYWKRREEDERHAAETRLKNYFFRSDWSYLPERAQDRLINADLIWSSPQQVSRESILNDLLRAAEEMCERFIVQSLVNDSTDILSIEAKMAERRRSLGVRDYIEICELPSMPSLLSERNLTDDEISFLTEDLPSSMRNLTRARNPADHEIGTFVSPELVDSAYRLFLGIGQPGILPELARIGRKL